MSTDGKNSIIRTKTNAQIKIENFIASVAQDSPMINPNNPLEGLDDNLITHTPAFFEKFIGALKTNSSIKKIIYPANKTIAQKEFTINALVTAIQKEPTLGGVKYLKMITCISEEKIIEAFQAHAATLEGVSLKWCPLSIPLAQKWAELIRNHSVLKSITLNVGREGGTDTDTCGMLLAESLQRNENITTIKMRSNDFGEKAALQFARLLTVNRTLTYLDLSSNHMGDNAMIPFFKALKNSNLHVLYLKDISLNGVDESTQHLAEALKENINLVFLSLFANSLDIIGAGLVAGALKFNFTLQHLDLYGNNIQNNGAEEIAKMLKVNRGLTHLSLQSNSITESGIQFIADSLHGNNTLTSLNLAANIIGKSGACLCRMLSVNTALIKLDLRFTDGKKHEIEEVLKTRTSPLEVLWLL